MRVVILLGAGATLSDVETRAHKYRPPLDKGFFALARQSHPSLAEDVARYMREVYGADIGQGEEDSLEATMGQIYTDLFNPALEDRAREAFRGLLQLFNRRLAETTNNIDATHKRLLYRILTHYLGGCGVKPEDLTIITFNQDLQVEKCLLLMSETARWKKYSAQLFNFPWLYRIGGHELTAPIRKRRSAPLFERSPEVDDSVHVLKLHGSLNWYSKYDSPAPSPEELFDPERNLAITRRKVISPTMGYTGESEQTYTLPVVVPPVTHKSAVLHNALKAVWGEAEDALKRCDELVIFGYSCPPLDFESSNQLRRAQRGRDAHISVIDPNSAVVARYIDLLAASHLSYFPSASKFLAHR